MPPVLHRGRHVVRDSHDGCLAQQGDVEPDAGARRLGRPAAGCTQVPLRRHARPRADRRLTSRLLRHRLARGAARTAPPVRSELDGAGVGGRVVVGGEGGHDRYGQPAQYARAAAAGRARRRPGRRPEVHRRGTGRVACHDRHASRRRGGQAAAALRARGHDGARAVGAARVGRDGAPVDCRPRAVGDVAPLRSRQLRPLRARGRPSRQGLGCAAARHSVAQAGVGARSGEVAARHARNHRRYRCAGRAHSTLARRFERGEPAAAHVPFRRPRQGERGLEAAHRAVGCRGLRAPWDGRRAQRRGPRPPARHEREWGGGDARRVAYGGSPCGRDGRWAERAAAAPCLRPKDGRRCGAPRGAAPDCPLHPRTLLLDRRALLQRRAVQLCRRQLLPRRARRAPRVGRPSRPERQLGSVGGHRHGGGRGDQRADEGAGRGAGDGHSGPLGLRRCALLRHARHCGHDADQVESFHPR